jgi:hypothetical protein
MDRESSDSEPRQWDRSLRTDEQCRLTEAIIRGLKWDGRNEFTDAELRSVLDWAEETRIRAVLFDLVLKGRVDVNPDPDGDPKKVLFHGAHGVDH